MPNFDIAHSRLVNQHIAESTFQTPHEVVAWLCAVQAQDYFGAKWSLGQRIAGSIDTDIEQAFTDGSILRTHLLRPTWHFVTPSDIRWLLKLTSPRVQSINVYMYRNIGMDIDILNRSSNIFVNALRGGFQLTRDELIETLNQSGIVVDKKLQMVYLLMYAELEGLICSGARRGKQFTYALLDERVPMIKPLSREESLMKLADRYFKSRGPASVFDFAKWSGLTVNDARQGLETVKGQLERTLIDEREYWFPPVTLPALEITPKVYLLSIYDEYVSSYKDHNAIQTAEIGTRLAAMGNDLTYIIVINGQITGTWKRIIGKDRVVVKTSLFVDLTANEKEALTTAAHRYGNFLLLPAVLE